MKAKSILFLVFSIGVASCASSQKVQPEVINSFFHDKNRIDSFNKAYPHLKLSESDSIIIIAEPIDKRRISDALNWPEKYHREKGHIAPIWLDSLQVFTLTKPDIEFMCNQTTTAKVKEWNTGNLKINNVIFASADSVFGINATYSEIKTGKRYLVYQLSEAAWNKEKDIAVFYCLISFNSASSDLKWTTIIMRKIKDKWLYVGEVFNTFETGF